MAVITSTSRSVRLPREISGTASVVAPLEVSPPLEPFPVSKRLPAGPVRAQVSAQRPDAPHLEMTLPDGSRGTVDALLLTELWTRAHDFSLEGTVAAGIETTRGLVPRRPDAAQRNALRIALAEGYFQGPAAAEMTALVGEPGSAATSISALEARDSSDGLRALFAALSTKHHLSGRGGDDLQSAVTALTVGALKTAWRQTGNRGFSPPERAVVDAFADSLQPGSTERWIATQVAALKVEDGVLTGHLGAEPAADPRIPTRPLRAGMPAADLQASELVRNVIANPDARPSALELHETMGREPVLSPAAVLAHAPGGIAPLEQTLRECRTLAPVLSSLARGLLRDHPDARLVFLGRDGEYLSDAYQVLARDAGKTDDSVLMPASGALYSNFPGSAKFNRRFPGLAAVLEEPALVSQLRKGMSDNARAFFRQYGLGPEQIADARPILLLDTGFMGTIGKLTRESVGDAYGLDPEMLEQKIEMKSVHADFEAAPYNSTLRRFSQPAEDLETLLPRLFHSEVTDFAGQRRLTDDRYTFALASAMQLLPHAHGTFHFVGQKEGQVVAYPERPPASAANADTVGNDLNAQVVSPLAALAVQVKLLESLRNEQARRLGGPEGRSATAG